MEKSWKTEEELLIAFQSDLQTHSRALGHFIEKNPHLGLYVRRQLSPNDTEADDLFQEILMDFSERVKKPGFRPDKTLVQYWYGIARHKCKDWHRLRKAKSKRKAEELLEEAVELPDRELLLRMEKMFEETITRLNDRCVQVLFDLEYTSVSKQDVAIGMGLSGPRKASKVYYECKEKLKKIIEREFPELVENIHLWL